MSERIDFCFDPLDKNFRPPKPVQNIDGQDLPDEKAAELVRAGVLGMTRKRDGHRHLTIKVVDNKLYTRGINEATAKFPHLVKEIAALNLPPVTMLDGEILFERNGQDDWEIVHRICNSGPERAIELQKELGWTKYMIFNIIFWNGYEYIKRPYQQNYDLIHALVPRPTEYLLPVEFLNVSYEEALEIVKSQGWEGLVLWDKTRGSDYSLDGTTIRPPVCWKKKLLKEDDFIVRGWEPSKVDPNRVAKVYISQIDPDTGQEFSCGACGGGFTLEERYELANDALYPFVAEIKFYKRFSTGSLFVAKFARIRTDKGLEECIASQSFGSRREK